MSESAVTPISFHDEPALELVSGGYRAVIVPGVGSHVAELSKPGDGLSLLRTAPSGEVLRKSAQRYGIPALFPPNRIMEGKFSTPYRTYELPLNSSDGKDFMHGILHKRPWKVQASGVLENGAAQAVLVMHMGQDGEMFAYFPHEFTYELTYTLSEEGLHQQVRITNHSGEPMPLGVGFHTALRVPFHPEGREEDYRLTVSVGQAWGLTPSFVSDGTLHPLEEADQALRHEGIRPTGAPYAKHFTGEPMEHLGRRFYGAVLTDTSRGISLVYEADPAYGHWTIWNDDGQSGFICPEPQTWTNNAPNVELPEAVTGFRLLAPGEVWTASTRLYVESK
ncbi:aldose 1-epimerase [Paenibacillus rigui]|uniref:Aldose epimerase n=1 Tax=Paenibacillus rigui TaxID=554312 RepID=A0A229UP02_9BACL|nr:aldose 1-epimerase [Paenibacillus rigui]OXM85130.1 aldose epimerase [Paenibacillus rigui]